MIDLEPATTALSTLLDGVRDEQLAVSTPCAGTSLGDLLDHVDGLSLAFTATATKTPIDGAPSADASRLGQDWRTRVPERLRALASAWRDDSAWVRMTRAGGVDLPAEVAGVVVLNEVVVHGWDIAVSSGSASPASRTCSTQPTASCSPPGPSIPTAVRACSVRLCPLRTTHRSSTGSSG